MQAKRIVNQSFGYGSYVSVLTLLLTILLLYCLLINVKSVTQTIRNAGLHARDASSGCRDKNT